MRKGYVIPHTHWDREWRYPIWENRMYLVDLIDELLETLDNEKEYKSFLFDGQTISLLDYIEVRPKNEDKLKKYIKEGRILVGPWYTLPDLYPICGESLVRNLLKGNRTANTLGKCLQVGYESFGWGQTAQFPQIYKGFNIDTVFVAKNVDRQRAPNCEFIWEGADGTKIIATRLGDEARANFFMNTTLHIKNGMSYKSDDYKYNNGNQGMVFHQADTCSHHQDYFLIEHDNELKSNETLEVFYKAWDGLKDTLIPDTRPLMNGSDSTTAQPFLIPMIKKINSDLKASGADIEIESSSIEDYANLLKKIDTEKIITVVGEMRDGPSPSLSANALMTRPYIKALNKKVQNELFGCAEPFAVATDSIGHKYDNGFIEKALDYMLLSHPHDSINGVTQDKTVNDVMYRLNQSLEISQTVYNTACKNILRNVDTSDFSNDDILITIFNPLPFSVSDQIKVFIDTPAEKAIWDFKLQDSDGEIAKSELISRKETVVPVSDLHSRPWPYYADRHCIFLDVKNVPAGGYKIYKLIPGETFNRLAEYWPLTRKTLGNELSKSGDTMENEFLHVKVNSNGTISVYDKKNSKMFNDLNYFEDEGDCGDYWIYYPPYNNKKVTSKGLNAEIWTEENNSLSCTIAAKVKMSIPAYAHRHMNGIKGESKRSDEMTEMVFTSFYTIRKDSQEVNVRLLVENNAEDHRLKVLFDTEVQGETAYAQGHFNVDKRPYTPIKDKNGQYYNELTTQPMQNFVDITDGEKGFGIITDSLIEYEAIDNKEGTLALTLFRAVRNIICTEMRSGGHFPDQKGGQCLGINEYNYAICPHAKDYKAAKLYEKSNKFNIKLKAVQTCKQLKTGTLPQSHSFYELTGGIELSALKKCEDSNDYLLRVFNPYDNKISGDFIFSSEIKKAFITNLNEEMLEQMQFAKNSIKLDIDSKKILTIKFAI